MSRDSAAVHVLLVSRDNQTIEFLCLYMQKLAMHVEMASDVESATWKLCHCKFEGVIIDLELGVDALQLLEKLRDLTSHRHAISFVIVESVNETGADCKASRSPCTNICRRPGRQVDTARVSALRGCGLQ
jgi:DNA-binding NtrC family response regulator